MAFQITAAHSSRVTKRSTNPLLRRSSSSPFSTAARRKPTTTKPSLKRNATSISALANDEDDDDETTSRLADHGLITALATDLRLRDAAQYVRWITEHMFDPIPTRAGMNSTRIAEVLNYRCHLPPLVTTAHVHALSGAPTATEREIAELVRAGVLRRVVIPGRGVAGAGAGEALVLSEKWVQRVEEDGGLEDAVKTKYVGVLNAHPEAQSVPAGVFTAAEATALLKAGFLTSASTTASAPAAMLSSDSSSLGTLASLSTVGSRNASGSLGAVGGTGAIYAAGGGGGGTLGRDNGGAVRYNFALPSTGLYMKLLEAARNHLVAILAKHKFREAPKDMLRERWQGGVAGDEKAVRTKGLAGAVLPGRTRKWKQFYGARFEWILEECVGSGLVEVFDTGSVGHGVRLVS